MTSLARSSSKWPPVALAHAVGSGIGRALQLSSGSNGTPPISPLVEEALAKLFRDGTSGAYACDCDHAAAEQSNAGTKHAGQSASIDNTVPSSTSDMHSSTPEAAATPRITVPHRRRSSRSGGHGGAAVGLAPEQSVVFAVHGAHPGSFVAQLAEAMASLPSSKDMAQLWLAVVEEVARRFHAGEPTPHLAAPWDGPDLRLGEVTQHLQLLNCCVARRRKRQMVVQALEQEQEARTRHGQACRDDETHVKGDEKGSKQAVASGECRGNQEPLCLPLLCRTCGRHVAGASKPCTGRNSSTENADPTPPAPLAHTPMSEAVVPAPTSAPTPLPQESKPVMPRILFPRLSLHLRSPFSSLVPASTPLAAAAAAATSVQAEPSPAQPAAVAACASAAGFVGAGSLLASLAQATAEPQAAVRLAGEESNRSNEEESRGEEGSEAGTTVCEDVGPRQARRQEGALQPVDGLHLLLSGEPMYAPVTQDGPLMTEAAVRECEELIMKTGR